MHSLSKHSRLIQTAMTIRSHTKNKMLFTGLLVFTASLYAPLANASAIYKVVDEKTGQVTFTDRPQNYEQQADKQVSQTSVMTRSDALNSSNNSNTSGQSSSTAQAASTETTITPDADSSTVKTAVNYQLTITEPSEERAYRRPAQNIAVNVQVKPSLQAGDNVSIYLDGNEVAQGLNASIPTVDILPGSHSITAVVTNEKGKTLQQVARTVYVIQNNTTLQDNKRKAEQLLAYQNLSLYQKLLLKLRQSD
ncbi:DUF4124 domain-containing protein [Psychrobacter sp. SCQQ22]|uniref:DUF4124 domain-containing protein n=1 Tax=unclassified Psychrobacter TaxID=196806 RepID=UPI0018CFCE6A|nr:DUF4124 domain-containing protein [Psychrobacter sp. SCQQ22]MBH0086171.1 DUF4124 domain-containing protein [Psychrobacter sp. SCQQ22]